MVNFKRFTKNCVKKTLSAAGAYDWRHRGGVTLMTYHRVLPQAQLNEPMAQASLLVSTEAFERNMRFLRTRYTLISFSDYLNRVDNGHWASDQRYAMVTFDDGCFDNHSYAFPILAKYKIPATIFVVTGFIGTRRRFWWQVIGDAALDAYLCPARRHRILDAARAHISPEIQTLLRIFRARHARDVAAQADLFIGRLKAYPLSSVQHFVDECAASSETPPTPMAMTWEQIAEMSSHGIEFGSHSVNHHMLTALSLEDAAREIIDSASALQAHPEVNYTPVFSYPNGNANDQICSLVHQAGYRAAVTTESKVAGFRVGNPYRLPRIDIGCHVAASNLLFKFKLSRTSMEKTRVSTVRDQAPAA